MGKYDIVKRARQTSRVSAADVIEQLCSATMEMHGDRLSGEDHAIIGGVGLMEETPITFIGIQKGKSTKENIQRNFGSVRPHGYRKAIRLMEQAEKFNRPVLTLINTAGADATPESEEAGIGTAIAECLLTMSRLTVPTLAIVLGEGGSGGAIALALADQVWMLENSTYSILSPEGFASILWKDAKLAPEAAENMNLTSQDLYRLSVIEKIIPETIDEKDLSNEAILNILVKEIKQTFGEMQKETVEDRLVKRKDRFKQFQ
ncbi:acetyl-CoA carboxylase carboxyl transferase subunit alpha [Aerococcaceae bacterium DSM 111022]|nr:acetyl-CoA carboxylase carboxyl transferase subunit alpha [Aerococcaceae bacterium DSM 111022]